MEVEQTESAKEWEPAVEVDQVEEVVVMLMESAKEGELVFEMEQMEVELAKISKWRTRSLAFSCTHSLL